MFMDISQVRFHCDTEMEYIGVKDGEHWFECKICGEREATKHPNRPTTPEEKPRGKMTDYGNPTKISDTYN